MTKYNRNGSRRTNDTFAVQVIKSGGSLLHLESVSKDRKGWTASIVIMNGYAVGTLKSGVEVVRPFFRVKLDTTDRFQVDIGTGSGVKIAFHTGSNVIG